MVLYYSTNIVYRQRRLKDTRNKYKKIWSTNTERNNIVKNMWNNTEGSYDRKLQETLTTISKWGKEKFVDIPKVSKRAQAKLDKIRNLKATTENIHLIIEVEKALDDALKNKELWWSQRAKLSLLKEGT
ncbi:unnamed protein product [Vicia faba]|uniref:Uncharacterized protein n=1 Tax=Vicia faba TaxID=3906 RepID=A0AAV0Z8X1_VICFA|nr:unnamed protein product [Vicia faba]